MCRRQGNWTELWLCLLTFLYFKGINSWEVLVTYMVSDFIPCKPFGSAPQQLCKFMTLAREKNTSMIPWSRELSRNIRIPCCPNKLTFKCEDRLYTHLQITWGTDWEGQLTILSKSCISPQCLSLKTQLHLLPILPLR